MTNQLPTNGEVGDVSAVSWLTVDRLTADMCQLVIKYTFTGLSNITNKLVRLWYYQDNLSINFQLIKCSVYTPIHTTPETVLGTVLK